LPPPLALGGLAAYAVHGDRERGVRLARDRAEGHRSRRETLYDLARRLDLLLRHRRAPVLFGRFDAEEPADRQEIFGLLVEKLGEGAILVLLIAAHRVLKKRHRLRRPGMRFAAQAERIFTPDIERAAVDGRVAEGVAMATHALLRDLGEADAFDGGLGAEEETLDKG